jgi:phenylacetate-CoA ligase
VQEFWGVRLHEWYGATQAAGVFMCTCEEGVLGEGARGVLHSLDHRVLVEVIDPDTGQQVADGEVGEAVVTVLHRESFPCLRFRMGDRIRRLPAGSCRCGRPFASHESGTIARYDDMIKIRGLNVWPSLIDSVVLTPDVVAEYRGTVSMDAHTGREIVTVAVEFTRPLGDEEQGHWLETLGEALRRTVGLSFTLEAVPIGSLPKTDFKIRRWTDDREAGRRGAEART